MSDRGTADEQPTTMFREQLKALIERHRSWKKPPTMEAMADALEAEAKGLRSLLTPVSPKRRR